MDFAIDPAVELLHALSKRLTARLLGLATSKLSPGKKVRVAKALGKIQSAIEKAAVQESGVSEDQPTVVMDGVRFHLVGKHTEWVIDEKACATLFPRSSHPKAWRQSHKGGNVQLEVGPIPEE